MGGGEREKEEYAWKREEGRVPKNRKLRRTWHPSEPVGCQEVESASAT